MRLFACAKASANVESAKTEAGSLLVWESRARNLESRRLTCVFGKPKRTEVGLKFEF